MGKDYYAILGIARDASEDEIKKGYRKAAVKWHPDKWSGKSEADQKVAEEKFKDAAAAYEALSDKQKRAIYDQCGEEGLQQGRRRRVAHVDEREPAPGGRVGRWRCAALFQSE